jgi:nucleotide-binding universal stress UspA family protein
MSPSPSAATASWSTACGTFCRPFLECRFWNAAAASFGTTAGYRHATTAPIIMAPVDLSSEGGPLTEPIQSLATTLLDARPMARLACVNVLKTARIGLGTLTRNDGSSIHVNRLVELKNWAAAMRLSAERLTFHVLEGPDPAEVLLTLARNNHVDHRIVGARISGVRRYLGSVSTAMSPKQPVRRPLCAPWSRHRSILPERDDRARTARRKVGLGHQTSSISERCLTCRTQCHGNPPCFQPVTQAAERTSPRRTAFAVS